MVPALLLALMPFSSELEPGLKTRLKTLVYRVHRYNSHPKSSMNFEISAIIYAAEEADAVEKGLQQIVRASF